MSRFYLTKHQGTTSPGQDINDQYDYVYKAQGHSKQAFIQPYIVAASVPQPSFDEEEDDSPYAKEPATHSSWRKFFLHVLRLFLCITLFGAILGIPAIVTASSAFWQGENDKNQDQRNLTFWITIWVVSTYACGVAVFVFMSFFPYLFYGIAKFVNPAHKRYWRVFRPLKWPVTLVIAIVFSWYLSNTLIQNNDYVSYNYFNGDDQTSHNDDVLTINNALYTVSQILWNLVFWAIGYLFEKIMIIYISVHYHYRSDHKRIEQSKRAIQALSLLYETSIEVDGLYNKFCDQDIIIRDAVAKASSSKREKIKFFQKIGGASHKVLSAFGNMLGTGSHWFKPGSPYAIVEHALEQPASARALAQRIWLSLVPYGCQALTKDHIAQVIKLDQKEASEKAFAALDQDENSDIRLKELELMLIDMGKTRQNIYRNMQEIDHCINTFDWIALAYLAMMILSILVFNYVPILANLKEILAGVGVGIGFAVGRVLSDFINGCVFVFFKHPYDIGDRIDIYNPGDLAPISVIVKRVSLLYGIFESTDTGGTIQFPNSRLLERRIDNLTRSGNGIEKLTLCLNIKTSFKDLEYLQQEMRSFVKAPENCRDYKSIVSLRIKAIHDLDKMEVSMSITHKSNWSNGALKAARSSRLYCRLIELARTIPLSNPSDSTILGDEGKPNYLVVVSEEEAVMKRGENKLRRLKRRHDFSDVDVRDLDNEAKDRKKDQLKQAETKAYESFSSIPANIEGRAGERPVETTISSFQSADVRDVSIEDYGSHTSLYDTRYSGPQIRQGQAYRSYGHSSGRHQNRE